MTNTSYEQMPRKGYQLHELPPRLPAEGHELELHCVGTSMQRRFGLPAGLTEVGSGATCNLRLEGVGLRQRHFVVRREGARIFVRLISGEANLAGVSLVGRVVAWNPGDVLAAGQVRFRLERITRDDRTIAVETPSLSVRGFLEGDPAPAEGAGPALNRLSDALLAGRVRGAVRYDRVLEAIAPNAASLYRGSPGAWQLLAELLPPDGGLPPPEPDDASEGAWVVLDEEINGEILRLLMRSPHATWSLALGRFALRMLAAEPAADAGGGATVSAAVQDSDATEPWSDFVGSRIRQILADAMPVCRFAHSVLILGETGTGKELAARALHKQWQRSGPFVALNCAALPETLLDAELFGVASGAATGVAARAGRFEQAEGGTLFLDEISEMPLPLQSKMLRVLQERSYYRVGGSSLLQADVHIVASSNRTAEDLQSGDTFRTDLYYRLAQGTLFLPPLRERSGDLASLCAQYLGMLEAQFGRGVRGLSTSALDAMKAYAWPGNVRELQNVLRTLYGRAARGELIRASHLPEGLVASDAETARHTPKAYVGEGTLAARVEALERDAIVSALESESTVQQAAARLGISPSYLYRKIRKLELGRVLKDL